MSKFIDNSFKSAIKTGSWKNPGAKLYDKICEIDKSALSEAYLVGPTKKNTTYTSSGCKYPHHTIINGKLVVNIPGLKAAYSRAKQMGIYKGEVKEHLQRHYKQLGIYDSSQMSVDDKITENFEYIESSLDNEYLNEEYSELNSIDKELDTTYSEACKDLESAREFVSRVKDLANEYDANFFIVTDGASGIHNNGNPAVKHARDCQIEWEKENGFDPDEDWSQDIKPKDINEYENILSESIHQCIDEYFEESKKKKHKAGTPKSKATDEEIMRRLFPIKNGKYNNKTQENTYNRKHAVTIEKKITEEMVDDFYKRWNGDKNASIIFVKGYPIYVVLHDESTQAYIHEPLIDIIYNGKTYRCLKMGIDDETLLYPPVAQRKTIYHELGHLLLQRSDINHKFSDKDKEKQKNFYDKAYKFQNDMYSKYRNPINILKSKFKNDPDYIPSKNEKRLLDNPRYYMDNPGYIHGLGERELEADKFAANNIGIKDFQRGSRYAISSVKKDLYFTIMQFARNYYKSDKDLDTKLRKKFNEFCQEEDLKLDPEYIEQHGYDYASKFEDDYKSFKASYVEILLSRTKGDIWESVNKQLKSEYKNRLTDVKNRMKFAHVNQDKETYGNFDSKYDDKSKYGSEEVSINDELYNECDIIEESIVEDIVDMFLYEDYQEDLIEESFNDIESFIYEGHKMAMDSNTPQELLTYMMSNFKPGFVHMTQKTKSTKNVPDIRFGLGDDQKFASAFTLQSPSRVETNKVGTSWDFCELEREWFSRHSYQFSIFYLELANQKKPVQHTFLIYYDQQKYWWFEFGWSKQTGIKPYENLSNALQDIMNKIRTENNDSTNNIILRWIANKPKSGIDAAKYIDHARNSIQIDTNNLPTRLNDEKLFDQLKESYNYLLESIIDEYFEESKKKKKKGGTPRNKTITDEEKMRKVFPFKNGKSDDTTAKHIYKRKFNTTIHKKITEEMIDDFFKRWNGDKNASIIFVKGYPIYIKMHDNYTCAYIDKTEIVKYNGKTYKCLKMGISDDTLRAPLNYQKEAIYHELGHLLLQGWETTDKYSNEDNKKQNDFYKKANDFLSDIHKKTYKNKYKELDKNNLDNDIETWKSNRDIAFNTANQANFVHGNPKHELEADKFASHHVGTKNTKRALRYHISSIKKDIYIKAVSKLRHKLRQDNELNEKLRKKFNELCKEQNIELTNEQIEDLKYFNKPIDDYSEAYEKDFRRFKLAYVETILSESKNDIWKKVNRAMRYGEYHHQVKADTANRLKFAHDNQDKETYGHFNPNFDDEYEKELPDSYWDQYEGWDSIDECTMIEEAIVEDIVDMFLYEDYQEEYDVLNESVEAPLIYEDSIVPNDIFTERWKELEKQHLITEADEETSDDDKIDLSEDNSEEESPEEDILDQPVDEEPPSLDEDESSEENQEEDTVETPTEDEVKEQEAEAEEITKDDKTNELDKDNEEEISLDDTKVEDNEEDNEEDKSMPQKTDDEESDKNGKRRKKLYIEFINWCKEFNNKNSFGSVFDKDAFHNTYPFVPDEMRYFYRISNPMVCVLSGDLTFFPLADLHKINSDNKEMNKYLIFAATEKDMRVFNIEDKKVYLATDENGTIKLVRALGDTFDNYLQQMINHGDILNGPIPETYGNEKKEDTKEEIKEESVNIFEDFLNNF